MSNPIADYNAYDAAEIHRLSNYPVCDYCQEPICDDKLYDISGRLYHADCAMDTYQRDTLDYMRGWRE